MCHKRSPSFFVSNPNKSNFNNRSYSCPPGYTGTACEVTLTMPPTTEAPATQAAVTYPQVTQAPVTFPQVTQAAVTYPPVSFFPVATTQAPATQPACANPVPVTESTYPATQATQPACIPATTDIPVPSRCVARNCFNGGVCRELNVSPFSVCM